LSQYDLVISSSAAFAGGHPASSQKHIAYVHTAVRYAWDQSYEYLSQHQCRDSCQASCFTAMLHRMRMWDVRTAASPDLFVANSAIVKRRIEQTYGRRGSGDRTPRRHCRDTHGRAQGRLFVVASRLVPYKRIDLVVRAFNKMPSLRLLVVRRRPEMPRLRALAAAKCHLRRLPAAGGSLETIQKARAFVFAAYEDFGIVFGRSARRRVTPVEAFGRGGAADIVVPLQADKPTGVLFSEQSVDAVKGAVELFCREESRQSPRVCRANVESLCP
jgi:glycosyltransferase involved in cell wall biosynthesis